MTAKIFTIAPGVPFVDALAAGLLDRAGGDPLALAAMTVLLPTRRACRALADAFLRASGGAALLLPRLAPLGELDDSALGGAADAPGVAESFDLPPAMPELRRRLLLAQRIHALGGALGDGMTAARAARLAEALAGLIDQVQTERLTFARLGDLVEAEYAAHWQITLDFLKLVTEHWPRDLARAGCLDPADRRNRLIEAQSARWRADPPRSPVIAAGSTGSVPATAELIAVVAGLPQGAVVLPGLDTGLPADDAAAIAAAHPGHPQHGMLRLLARLGTSPAAVRPWPSAVAPVSPPARTLLVRHALRPAVDSGQQTAPPIDAAAALAGVRLVVCPGSHEEALVIALAMRRALEIPGRTAALVTPDRSLARRVAAELARWDIRIDDSAGRPLADTPPGAFLRLVARMAAEDAAPVPLLALLKHPLAAGGSDPAAFRAAVRMLEIAVLRGPRPAPGIGGLRAALAAADDRLPRPPVSWLDGLERSCGPLLRLMQGGPAAVADLLDAHVACTEALAATAELSGPARLWAAEAGEAAAGFIAELAEAAPALGAIAPADWPALFETLMAGRVVRPRWGLHPRLHIWGPLEARLQHADLVCLGGLNEGTWPADPGADPWMSRPMRARFGLPPPERRIGLAAHDFAQLFCAGEVLLTRADRVDGTPTVPSRWLLRLENALQGVGGATAVESLRRGTADEPWLGWQAALDRPGAVRSAPPPAPCPPVAVRPRRLSVTQVETWMRDPYAIYARHVLRLRPLDPIDDDPGAAERGTMIHAALDEFVRSFPDDLPPDALDRLLACGRRAFQDAMARPGVAAFWWPRFERIAAWFVAEERDYRATVAALRTELRGELVIDGPAGPFRVTAMADRVDRLKAGGLSIIDYKTGATPQTAEIAAGFAPQLPLEAAIAMAGGFGDAPGSAVANLEFWRLTGGEPAGTRKPAGADIAALARDALAGIAGLVARFDDPATPYLSQPDPALASRYPEYDHLARVKEWSSPGLGGGG